MEDAGFFRIYPLGKTNAFYTGLFLQAELGTAIFFKDNDSSPSFLGALAAGWRINMGKNFFIEPVVRGGYPFLWSAGVTIGISFNGIDQVENKVTRREEE
jgi:hypothetical protein